MTLNNAHRGAISSFAETGSSF